MKFLFWKGFLNFSSSSTISIFCILIPPKIIKSYFFELRPPYKIHYVDEEIPLGTAGSIRLIDRNFESPVIITNCDTLVEADFGKILEYHAASGNSITVISALKNIVVPYGVLHAQKIRGCILWIRYI